MTIDIKKHILKTYCKVAKKLKAHPSRTDLGISRNSIRHHFNNMEGLKTAAKEFSPESFDQIIDETRFNDKVLKALQNKVKTFKRFVITTAVAGTQADPKFYASIKNYCQKRDALLLVLPSDNDLVKLDPNLIANENIVFDDISLNSNLKISSIKIKPKMIDPVTGLARIAQKCSFIFGSPKQRLQPVPTSNAKFPHVLMTTGAITRPRYKGKSYVNHRTDYIANHDHVMGAVIVEIENNEIYHFRQIQCDSEGKFIDLFLEYSTDSVKKVNAAAIIMGDFHSGDTDPTADAVAAELCAEGNPEFLVGHDINDGKANNHHDKHKRITMAKKSEQHRTSLSAEGKQLAKDVEMLRKRAKKFVWVKSNHDEVLHRWLEDGDYVNDPLNHLLGHKLAVAMVEGRDPLQELVYINGVPKSNNIIWLDRDQDFTIAGIQLGAHGDLGPNGSRGNIRAMEQCYGKSVTGHSHSAIILRGAWSVGTTSNLRLSYNRGSSSWSHTHCIVYPNGQRQLINSIKGKWRLK